MDRSDPATMLADQVPPSSDVPHGRLRQIAGRLATGFYDSPAVLDAVAWRIVDDVGLGSRSER